MINKNSDKINALLLEGISLFNMGKFFDSHETIETAWHMEKAPIRTLYKGLIQLSVACFHAERQNWVGARRVLQRARGNIVPFIEAESIVEIPEILHQIDVLDENITRILNSTFKDAELLVSPQLRLKSGHNQGINPESE